MTEKYAIIKSLLQTSDEFLYLCLKKLWMKQTIEEMAEMVTLENNGEGFNHADAFHMSKYAEWTDQGLPLTHSELQDARRRIIKYTTQLSNLLTEEDLLL